MLDADLQSRLQRHQHIGQSSYYGYSYLMSESHAFVLMPILAAYLAHFPVQAS